MNNDYPIEILITKYVTAHGRIYRTRAREEHGEYRAQHCIGPGGRYFRPTEAVTVDRLEYAIEVAKARIAKEIAKTEKRLERLRKLEIREVQA